MTLTTRIAKAGQAHLFATECAACAADVSSGVNGSANSSSFTLDGFFKELRDIEIVPPDPLTGN